MTDEIKLVDLADGPRNHGHVVVPTSVRSHLSWVGVDYALEFLNVGGPRKGDFAGDLHVAAVITALINVSIVIIHTLINVTAFSLVNNINPQIIVGFSILVVQLLGFNGICFVQEIHLSVQRAAVLSRFHASLVHLLLQVILLSLGDTSLPFLHLVFFLFSPLLFILLFDCLSEERSLI